MKISAIDHTLLHSSIDVYISGCKAPHCVGCHNAELWGFDKGEDYSEETFNKIKVLRNLFPKLIKNVMIFGGEPLDQDHYELLFMLRDLTKLNLPIWLFTRYSIEKVPLEIRLICSYIKTGKYDKDLLSSDNIKFGIPLASSNQTIYKLSSGKYYNQFEYDWETKEEDMLKSANLN